MEKRGRRRKPEVDKLNVVVPIRFSAELLAILDAERSANRARPLSRAQWIKSIYFGKSAVGVRSSNREFWIETARTAGNIRQLRDHFGSGSDISDLLNELAVIVAKMRLLILCPDAKDHLKEFADAEKVIVPNTLKKLVYVRFTGEEAARLKMDAEGMHKSAVVRSVWLMHTPLAGRAVSQDAQVLWRNAAMRFNDIAHALNERRNMPYEVSDELYYEVIPALREHAERVIQELA